MASFDFLAITISILGLAASIVYYANILRNSNQTQRIAMENRNAQFFLQIFSTTWYDEGIRLLFSEPKWSSYDEWWELYGPENNPKGFTDWFKGMTVVEMYGVLVKRGILTADLIDDMMSGYILWIWNVYGPIIEEMRVRFGYPQLQEHQEYLSNEIRKIVEVQHPDYRGTQL